MFGEVHTRESWQVEVDARRADFSPVLRDNLVFGERQSVAVEMPNST